MSPRPTNPDRSCGWSYLSPDHKYRVPNPFLLARERPPPGKLAKRLSTRSVRLARMILIQAIRNAMVTDVAARNVAGQLRRTREATAEPLGYQYLDRWDD